MVNTEWEYRRESSDQPSADIDIKIPAWPLIIVSALLLLEIAVAIATLVLVVALP